MRSSDRGVRNSAQKQRESLNSRRLRHPRSSILWMLRSFSVLRYSALCTPHSEFDWNGLTFLEQREIQGNHSITGGFCHRISGPKNHANAHIAVNDRSNRNTTFYLEEELTAETQRRRESGLGTHEIRN